MANLRKPLALKQLQGTDKKNKHRINDSQPVPDRGIGPPSEHLNEQEKLIWDELVSNMYAGVLGDGDRMALELMCRLVREMRYNFEEMPAAKLTQLSNLLGRFGLTPSDRNKIIIPKTKQDNPFAGL